MSLLQAVFRPKHDYLPGTEVLPEIDLHRLKSELALAAKGEEDGGRDFPRAADDALTETEIRIQTKFKQLRQEAISRTQQAAEVYESRMRAQAVAADEARLRAMPGEAKIDLSAQATTEIDFLSRQRVEVRRRDQDFREFKSQQKIKRAPKPPISKVLAAGITGIAVAVELMFNAYLFQVGNELGYLGAVFEALMVPILNVTATFLIVMYGVRQINRRELYRKIIGWVTLFFWLFGMFGFNLLVAHYRDALGTMITGEAGVFALDHFLRAPLGLIGINSWAILLIGVMVSVVVFLEAWRWDDPIPGYGDVERARVNAVDEFNTKRETALKDLKEIVERHKQDMTEARRNIDLAAKEAGDISQRHDHLRNDLVSYFSYLELCAAECIAAYREANVKARKTPEPAHFATPIWQADPYDLPPIFVPDVLTTGGEKARRRVKDDLEAGLLDLNKSHADEIARINSLSELVSEEQ